MFERVDAFVRHVRKVESEAELAAALNDIAHELGFAYFALTHHVDLRAAPGPSIRCASYPAEWVEYFDANRLALSDPVHRASHLTSIGFPWSRLTKLIRLTPADEAVLALAAARGLGDGFTVPANVPGESNGSCSFATKAGVSLSEEHLPAAQLVGAFAFEAARRIWRIRGGHRLPAPILTDRQRECVIWAARGKSDWEIAQILGISHETVVQYLKRARERYGASKRTLLTIQALFDGTISFADVLRRR